MKKAIHLFALITLVSSSFCFTGCSQQDRTNRVVRRQDRIDERTAGRQERWRIRGEREDARSEAFFDSM